MRYLLPALLNRIRPSLRIAERHVGYRTLFRDALDAGFIGELRVVTNGGYPRFKRDTANALGRRVAPLPRGWLPKRKTKDHQPSLHEFD